MSEITEAEIEAAAAALGCGRYRSFSSLIPWITRSSLSFKR